MIVPGIDPAGAVILMHYKDKLGNRTGDFESRIEQTLHNLAGLRFARRYRFRPLQIVRDRMLRMNDARA